MVTLLFSPIWKFSSMNIGGRLTNSLAGAFCPAGCRRIGASNGDVARPIRHPAQRMPRKLGVRQDFGFRLFELERENGEEKQQRIEKDSRRKDKPAGRESDFGAFDKCVQIR